MPAACWGGATMDIETLPSRHWEQEARKARAKAKTMNSAEARRLMLDIARRYHEMAAIASKRSPEMQRSRHFLAADPLPLQAAGGRRTDVPRLASSRRARR